MKRVFEYDVNMAPESALDADLVWHDAKEPIFGLYGSDALGEPGFSRLTEAERNRIRPVNDGEAWFAEHSAGIQVRFETDSSRICLRVKLRGKFDMTNMTQIGQCGSDLYVCDERVGGYALHEVARFPFDAAEYQVPLGHFDRAERKLRKYILYLPLYMATDKYEIGLDRQAEVRPTGFSDPVRIGVYGTSITHGCSASRPGMAYTNILSRKLDAEVLNFGFSGVAFMEREMGEILGRRRLDFLMVDTEANAGIDQRLERNAEGFLDAFFSENPGAGVVLFSRIPFALDLYDEYRAKLNKYYVSFLRGLARRYVRRGYAIGFCDASRCFRGNFTEYTADGIHPDDMGMVAIARMYQRQFALMKQKFHLGTTR